MSNDNNVYLMRPPEQYNVDSKGQIVISKKKWCEYLCDCVLKTKESNPKGYSAFKILLTLKNKKITENKNGKR